MSGHRQYLTLERVQSACVVGTEGSQVLTVISPTQPDLPDYCEHFERYWVKIFQYVGAENLVSLYRIIW
jgi:hypothetical protein